MNILNKRNCIILNIMTFTKNSVNNKTKGEINKWCNSKRNNSNNYLI